MLPAPPFAGAVIPAQANTRKPPNSVRTTVRLPVAPVNGDNEHLPEIRYLAKRTPAQRRTGPGRRLLATLARFPGNLMIAARTDYQRKRRIATRAEGALRG